MRFFFLFINRPVNLQVTWMLTESMSLEFEMKNVFQSTANGFVFLCPRLTHCTWCTQPVIPQLSNPKLQKSEFCIVDCKNASPALEEDNHLYSERLSATTQSSLETVQSKDNHPTKSCKTLSHLWKPTGQHTVSVHICGSD